MNQDLTETDEGRQRAVIEEIIERTRPGVEFCWASEGITETHILKIKGPGYRIRLRISQDSLEATDDPANIPQLEQEVERQWKISESGGVGYVKFPA
jgi:hypothetical protein